MFKRLSAFILDIFQVIVFAVAIFLFVYLLILQPHKIHGKSMFPSFEDGEYLLTDKLSYRFNEPERGDVVVFKAPPDGRDEFIKRIIGLPGEVIKIENGKIYVNDQLLPETYISTSITQTGSFLAEGVELKIPEDSYFVLGDNRDHSFDSRSFGYIQKGNITGRAWVVYWPPQQSGLIEKVSY